MICYFDVIVSTVLQDYPKNNLLHVYNCKPISAVIVAWRSGSVVRRMNFTLSVVSTWMSDLIWWVYYLGM